MGFSHFRELEVTMTFVPPGGQKILTADFGLVPKSPTIATIRRIAVIDVSTSGSRTFPHF